MAGVSVDVRVFAQVERYAHTVGTCSSQLLSRLSGWRPYIRAIHIGLPAPCRQQSECECVCVSPIVYLSSS